jgi:predicted amino acid racemase
MMLLDRVVERNPALLEAAFELHRSGAIPSATFLVDLDAVAHNAHKMADEAHRCGLRVYVMTKQHGRNPFVTKVALAEGLDSTVSVEAIEAHILNRHGIPIGHVGHLSNMPQGQIRKILEMDPEVMTVFSYENAKAISDAAGELGRIQNIYARIGKYGDETFEAMRGGWTEDECVEGIKRVLELPNVHLHGLTAFPCVSYGSADAFHARPTNTFETMLRAKAKLEGELGLENLRVNAPANNNCATFKLLADAGATDVEPGTGIMGSSLFHAEHPEMAEIPAQVYVTEVMHRWEGQIYTLGAGAAYLETYGVLKEPHPCLAGKSLEEARNQRTTLRERGVIDYHMVCDDNPDIEIGDTAVYALHPQFFVTRAYVTAVSGISEGAPRVEGIFDCATNALDENFQQIPQAEINRRVDDFVASRRSAVTA